jgi:hypothetical protein
MDWGQALKVGGPAAVAAYVFYSLISSYIERSGLLETSLELNIVLLVVIFVFCVFLAWLLFARKNKSSMGGGNELRDNEIKDNFSSSDINIGKNSKIISGNEIKGNKSDGDINVG